MRVSSLQIFNIARTSMAEANKEMMKTQEQMSTNKRVLTPADDPVAYTKILQLTDELGNIDQYLKNIDIAENNLNMEEAVLGSVVSVIQNMQELAVAAGNTATLTESDYRSMAEAVSTRIDELISLMNTRNANGDYIFGGYKSAGQPFNGDAFSGFQYQGDDGQQFIKIANNTNIAATDSGKTAFLDVQSANKTMSTLASPANTANPPARISLGEVVNQQAYDDFYPEDMVISFNADSNINPPGKNFTATERSTGRVIVANQPYNPGHAIELKGVSVKITGSPASGSPAVAATKFFGEDLPQAFPADFTAPNNTSFSISVGGRTERLVLDTNITSTADLAANLNNVTNGNAARLANLGITVDNNGLRMASGVNITIASGAPAIDAVLGINATAGSQSTNGQAASAGDRFFIESTEKQGILTTLARFKNAMENFDGSDEGKRLIADVVAATLSNLGNGLNSVIDVQTKIGARVNSLEATRDLHLDTQIVSKEVMTKLSAVDYAEAATRLAQQSLILKAAQQSFLQVSQLSLFDRM